MAAQALRRFQPRPVEIHAHRQGGLFLRAGNVARIVSSVRVYANANQASLIFQATATPKAQAAAYQVVFALTSSLGKTEPLPTDVFVFQAGQAIGALSFTAVLAKRDEVELTRLVASRLFNS
jgi:hypothetical protein